MRLDLKLQLCDGSWRTNTGILGLTIYIKPAKTTKPLLVIQITAKR